MKVYYATMTGNAESLASALAKKAGKQGLEADLVNLDEVSTEDLAAVERAVFVVSTWGEGEPPDDAEPFWEDLQASSVSLSAMQYAVFGLGDTGYTEFNGFAKLLDGRLRELGAKAVLERVDADIDYDDDYDAWEEKVLATFPSL